MADVKFNCPHCGQHIECDDQLCGRGTDCPTCGGEIVIPSSRIASSQVESVAEFPKRWPGRYWVLGIVLLVASGVICMQVIWTKRPQSTAQRVFDAETTKGGQKNNGPPLPTESKAPTVGVEPLATVRPWRSSNEFGQSRLAFDSEAIQFDSKAAVAVNDPLITLAIIHDEGNGLSVYPGSFLAVMVMDLGRDKPLAGRTQLTVPGSLLFIAEGGVERSTVEGRSFSNLIEGFVYIIDESGVPQLSRRGEYSVWVSFQHPRVHSSKDERSEVVYSGGVNERLRLLLPGSESDGWHKVRIEKAAEIDGWVRGEWESVKFMKHRRQFSDGGTQDKARGGKQFTK